jgi:transposase
VADGACSANSKGEATAGSYATLARYTQRLRQAQEGAAPQRSPRKRPLLPSVIDPPGRPLTPRTAAWLALRRPERRDADGAERLARLRDQNPRLAEAVSLAEEFAGLLRAREPERLDPWLRRARGGALPPFRGFAKRLGADETAVRAAVTLPWSTGPVEGQINRKTIKRQMYGRARVR